MTTNSLYLKMQTTREGTVRSNTKTGQYSNIRNNEMLYNHRNMDCFNVYTQMACAFIIAANCLKLTKIGR